MLHRFWTSVLFLAVAVVALASPPSIRADASSLSTVTENVQSFVFEHSTSTATVIQVVCLATATSRLNATRTVISYTGVQTVPVVRATVTGTVPVLVTVTSSTTIASCYAFSENFVGTRVVSVPLVLYSEVQPTTTETATWHLGSCCVSSQILPPWAQTFTHVLVASLVLASLIAVFSLLWVTRKKQKQGKSRRS